MNATNWARNQANDGKDHLGRKLKVGQTVLKPSISGRTPVLETRRVEKIEDGKVYLSNPWEGEGWRPSRPLRLAPLQFSGRVCIIPEA